MNKDPKGRSGPGSRLKRLLELGEMKRPSALLYRYVKDRKLLYTELVLLMLGGIGITLVFTWFLQELTNAAISGNVDRIKELLLQGVILVIISSIVTYLSNYIGTAAVQQVKRDIKNDMFNHLIRLPASYFNRTHSGDTVSHLTNDVNNLDGAIGSNLIQMIRLPLMAAASLVYMLTISWKLSLLCFLLVPLASLSGTIFGKILRKNSRQIQEVLSGIQSFLQEIFSAQTIIRSFSLEHVMSGKYKTRNENLLEVEMQQAKLRGWFQVGSGAVGSATFFLSMGMGAFFVANRSMSVGDLVAFNNLMHYMVSPLSGLAALWGSFQRSLSSVERIVHVMEEPAEPGYSTDEAEAGGKDMGRTLIPKAPSIHMRGINFSYDGSNSVLEDLELFVPAGHVVALVGPSGVGKSTLFHLLQGFYAPTGGKLMYGAVPSDNLPLSELRRAIAYVPQETFLFSGTIRDNIAYGRTDATEDEIILAAKDANAHDFIMKLPAGYDTEVGERGVRLSGGQRQRIAIARAILKDAPVLLLDEATSALDTETEALVRDALTRLMKNRTTMVIAHRLSTIQNADTIAVMDQGKIVETGSHWELMAKRGAYYRLYQLQFQDHAETLSTLSIQNG
jgi:ATP-binding cassette, subfamily B, bacterial